MTAATFKSQISHDEMMKDKTVKATNDPLLHNQNLYFVTKDGYYKVKADYVPYNEVPTNVIHDCVTPMSEIPDLFVIQSITRIEVYKFLDSFGDNDAVSYNVTNVRYRKDMFNVEVFAPSAIMKEIKELFGFNKE